MIDDRTQHKNLPLPNDKNLLSDDVERLRAALTAIDSALHTASQELSQALTTATEERTRAINAALQQVNNAINSLQTAVNSQLEQTAAMQRKTHTLALAGL